MRRVISFCRVGFSLWLTAAVTLGAARDTNESVFALKEVSRFDRAAKMGFKLFGQQVSVSSDEIPVAVKTWPAFKSGKPIYGSTRFDAVYGKPDSGIEYHFAFDESRGTGQGYDRLYFDHNRDLDLTNDKPLVPQNQPPEGAKLGFAYIAQEIYFDSLALEFDFGPAGKRLVEVLPRLVIYDKGRSSAHFVATKIRRGEIEIARQRFDALLGHEFTVGGRYDRPFTALHLIPKDAEGSETGIRDLQENFLGVLRKIGNTHYRFATTPTGDRLTVEAYDGAYGNLELGAGERDVQEMGILNGWLMSRNTLVSLEDALENPKAEKRPRRCRLPVGDYFPSDLLIRYGRLQVFLSDNYHSDGKPRDDHARVHGIKIRSNEPFILDFSNEPEVLFALPPKNHRVKAGEELRVKAVLIDPKLDIMIRGLDDTTATGGNRPFASLDPRVVITRRNGERVAEGVMPFG